MALLHPFRVFGGLGSVVASLILAVVWVSVSVPGTASGADAQPYCLAAGTMRFQIDCPSVDASVSARVLPDGIEISVMNESDVPWEGRPLAAESPEITADDTDVSAVNDALPDAYAEVVDRDDVAVSRCVFPSNVTAVEPGDSVRCILPGVAQQDELLIWLTGFIGGIPMASSQSGFGTEPTPIGVIPASTPRSVRINVALAQSDDVQAEVVAPRTIEASPVGIEQSDDSMLQPALLAAAIAVAGCGGLIGWQRRRARSTESELEADNTAKS